MTLYVDDGDGASKYTVHKQFACHFSPVFKAAFMDGFLEGKTLTYRLYDTTSDVVDLLVHWFYTQELIIEQKHTPSKRTFPTISTLLAKLWVLANFLLIPQLQELALKRLREFQKRYKMVAIRTLVYVFESTPEGSALRRFFLEQVRRDEVLKDLYQNSEYLSIESLIGLLEGYQAQLRKLSKKQLQNKSVGSELNVSLTFPTVKLPT